MSLMHSELTYLSSRARAKQAGMVIVVALFIVALVATLAYVMIARLDRDTRRTTLILRHMTEDAIAQGSLAWAMDMLANNWQKRMPKRLTDQLPLTSPVQQEDGYDVVSTIYDMQARYNLNNVTTPEKAADFARLLLGVAPKITKKQADDVAAALMDWLQVGSQTNAYAKYYLAQTIPYRPRHAAMLMPSELRLVKGVTPDIYTALQPYVTALPVPAPLNAQTMSAAVMLTLNSSMTLLTAKSVEDVRKTTPFTATDVFLNVDVIHNHKIVADNITVESTYFLVETKVSIEKQRTLIYTLLKRSAKDKKVVVSVIWQSKGSW